MGMNYSYFQDPRTILYFFKVKNHNIVKIGISTELGTCMKRFRLISNLSPFEIEDIIYYFNRKETRKLEKFFHKYYKNFRKKGEWFELPDKDLNRIKNFKKIKSIRIPFYKTSIEKSTDLS